MKNLSSLVKFYQEQISRFTIATIDNKADTLKLASTHSYATNDAHYLVASIYSKPTVKYYSPYRTYNATSNDSTFNNTYIVDKYDQEALIQELKLPDYIPYNSGIVSELDHLIRNTARLQKLSIEHLLRERGFQSTAKYQATSVGYNITAPNYRPYYPNFNNGFLTNLDDRFENAREAYNNPDMRDLIWAALEMAKLHAIKKDKKEVVYALRNAIRIILTGKASVLYPLSTTKHGVYIRFRSPGWASRQSILTDSLIAGMSYVPFPPIKVLGAALGYAKWLYGAVKEDYLIDPNDDLYYEKKLKLAAEGIYTQIDTFMGVSIPFYDLYCIVNDLFEYYKDNYSGICISVQSFNSVTVYNISYDASSGAIDSMNLPLTATRDDIRNLEYIRTNPGALTIEWRGMVKNTNISTQTTIHYPK